jgi:hypothetical protein
VNYSLFKDTQRLHGNGGFDAGSTETASSTP